MRTHRIGVEAASAKKARSVQRSGSRHVGRGQAPGGRPLPAHGAVTPPPRGSWAHPQGHVPHSPRPLSEHSWYHRPGYQMCQDQRDTRPRRRATPHSTAALGLAAASLSRPRRCHCLGSGGGQHPSPQRDWLFSKDGTPAKQPQVRHSVVAGGELGKAGGLSRACSETISKHSRVRPFPKPRGNQENVGTADAAHSRQRPSQTCLLAVSRVPFQGRPRQLPGPPSTIMCSSDAPGVAEGCAHSTAQHTPEKAEEAQLPTPTCRPGAVAPSKVQDTAC